MTATIPGHTPDAYLQKDTTGDGDQSGGQRAATEENTGRRRNLTYPPAPEPLPAPVVDNHTHLDLRDGNINLTYASALDTAEAVGVPGVITIGYDLGSSERAVQASYLEPRIRAAVALHPNEAPQRVADGSFTEVFAQICTLAEDERVVSVGETGLDYFRTGEDGIEAQKYSFAEHLKLAHRLNKPVQIHDRDAHDDVVAELEKAREGGYLPHKVVFHCFSGGEELARICNENGWYMSFSGTVTFKNSKDLQAALRIADQSLILAETDAPYLTPHPYRGRPNASYLMPNTVRFMAEHLGVELTAFCRQLQDNTDRVYGQWLLSI
ncbi:TatD family hydrolase [Micrococcoides hystricis]|uniref:TatD family hydrolase n=1 Tax=Micrococcoides hystricis TaxID=1572761 RepID=A0ABV6PAA1_9MICC